MLMVPLGTEKHNEAAFNDHVVLSLSGDGL